MNTLQKNNFAENIFDTFETEEMNKPKRKRIKKAKKYEVVSFNFKK